MAVCVTQFEPKLLERGIVCSPGLLTHTYAAVVSIQKVKYYKAQVNSKAKFHISIGHDTVIGKLTVFCSPNSLNTFSLEKEYLYCTSLYDSASTAEEGVGQQYALIEFERPILIVCNSLYISSKLDMDVHTNSCRIAFYGKVLEMFTDKNYCQTVLPKLKVYKNKCKSGVVDRITNDHEVICTNLFKKETRLDLFSGLRVTLSTGEIGKIDGCFGQSGKIRVHIADGLQPDTVIKLGSKKTKRNKSENDIIQEKLGVELKFKQYIYDVHKKIVQGCEE